MALGSNPEYLEQFVFMRMWVGPLFFLPGIVDSFNIISQFAMLLRTTAPSLGLGPSWDRGPGTPQKLESPGPFRIGLL